MDTCVAANTSDWSYIHWYVPILQCRVYALEHLVVITLFSNFTSPLVPFPALFLIVLQVLQRRVYVLEHLVVYLFGLF